MKDITQLVDRDEYGEVINGENTYREIVKSLRLGRSIIIGWTDENGTHLDILFSHNVAKAGGLQRGLRQTDIFVGISSWGMFGFQANGSWKAPRYVSEKLGTGGCGDELNRKLSELINGVCDLMRSVG